MNTALIGFGDRSCSEAALTQSNFREVHGQHASDGRSVGAGMMYRSEAMVELGAEDAQTLRTFGIKLVCDLRSSGEREHTPNSWWRSENVPLLELDLLASLPDADAPWKLLRANPSASGARAAMHAVYAGFPAASCHHIARLIRRIGNGAAPLLIHCTAGKDRTGFVIAILLSALGVSEAAIIDDYLASGGRQSASVIEATRRMITSRAGIVLPDEAMAALLAVDKDYLAESFATIKRDFGSVDDYLASGGLTSGELTAFRDRLLA